MCEYAKESVRLRCLQFEHIVEELIYVPFELDLFDADDYCEIHFDFVTQHYFSKFEEAVYACCKTQFPEDPVAKGIHDNEWYGAEK